MKEFLTNNFDELFKLFIEEKTYGRKSVEDVYGLIDNNYFEKEEIDSFKQFVKEKGYKKLIILPYIYIHKEIEIKNIELNDKKELGKKLEELTRQGFQLFEIGKELYDLLSTDS